MAHRAPQSDNMMRIISHPPTLDVVCCAGLAATAPFGAVLRDGRRAREPPPLRGAANALCGLASKQAIVRPASAWSLGLS